MDIVAGTWETVHTVHDHWDCPRVGAADLGAKPHSYHCIFDEEEDEWSDQYWLMPISEEQLALLKEDYALFLRWRTAFDAGTLGAGDSHPVLAADRSRHEEIGLSVSQVLTLDPTGAIRMRGEFERLHPVAPNRVGSADDKWRVRWTAAE